MHSEGHPASAQPSPRRQSLLTACSKEVRPQSLSQRVAPTLLLCRPSLVRWAPGRLLSRRKQTLYERCTQVLNRNCFEGSSSRVLLQ